ncbi:conserved hypothetical protein [Culex quinquefasciatus]|uniref:Single domain-containing protein n=4 Tax=Culex pipiens complex TaxID=518105 RepID=B0W6P6_CULQU|nr:uncharacterized protein LOC6033992 [Culex quinquefasciatus]XP_039436510.1 uncharacterized protein LOC120418259 [Culex pipiens pallens]XP_039442225.1 uncharacterized protein LOC120422748 [Culex pipiens pallens]EDS36877.1 conserved hypothetical protein [Culex quinquefasciatus]|eukprot:XP_001844380.1 conserved hypothetical protein [Culex quinquefasciatus]
MKPFTFGVFVVAAALCVANVFAADEPASTKDSKDEEGVKIYKRLIPADVLRDFPGMCFASTRCATIEPGKSWDLAPFCGRSTCVVSESNPAQLLELVEDCGPLPLANDKCKLDTDKTNKTAPFPYCCPKFTCEPGVKLEYPEIKPSDASEEKKN